jgi:PAS domain S-box-containing protein
MSGEFLFMAMKLSTANLAEEAQWASTPAKNSPRLNVESLHELRADRLTVTQRKTVEARLELQSAAIEAAANAIVMTDRSGKILFVNPAFTELTGYEAAEAIGENTRILKSGAHDAAFYANLWSTVRAGKVWQGEVLNRRKDGSLYFEEMTITPVHDADGEIAHFIAVKQDISRRKAAEEENERNLRRIAALHEIDLAIASTLDLRGVVEILLEKIGLFFPLASGSTVRLVDPRTGGLLPVACRNLDEEEWKLETKQISGELARILERDRGIKVFVDPQNDPGLPGNLYLEKWGVASLLRVPLLFRGAIIGLLSVFTRVRHEFTAREIEFVETLAGQAAIAIHNAQLFEQTERTVTRLGALREIDLAMASTVDLRRMLAILLEKIDFFLPHHAASVRLQNLQTEKLDLIASRNIDEEEWNAHSLATECHRHSYGVRVFESREPLTVSNIAADGEAGHESFLLEQGLLSFAGVPLIVKDQCLGVITLYGRTEREFSLEEIDFLSAVAGRAAVAIDNARLYESLKNQAEELARANRAKDDFLSVMSHELRTPLSVIIGYAGMLSDGMLGSVTETQKTVLRKMMQRGSDQLKIINSMMQAVQLQVGAMAVEPQTVRPAELLRELESDYRAIARKEISLEFDCPDTVPPLVTDEAKLKQILQNLIDNALKFTREGKVRISARERDGWIEFAAADTGIGIPERESGRIFDKFHQVDSSETRTYGGIGLGLFIVENFAELLGGSVSVKSAVGRGSTFTVRIPSGS